MINDTISAKFGLVMCRRPVVVGLRVRTALRALLSGCGHNPYFSPGRLYKGSIFVFRRDKQIYLDEFHSCPESKSQDNASP